MVDVTVKNNRLSFADGLRGLAALWVVFYHLAEGGHIASLKDAVPQIIFKPIFEFGHLGVPVFFVLSGYVMALTALNKDFNSTNSLKFILRRLARLIPPYYGAILFAACAILVKSTFLNIEANFPSATSLWQHSLFLQDFFKTPQINMVFWTLCIEVQFYLVFALLVFFADSLEHTLKTKNLRPIIFVLASALALLWPLKLIMTPLWSGGFIGFWYSFLAGTIACWGWNKKGSFLAIAIGYAGVILAIGVISQDSFAMTAGTVSCLLLLASHKEKMTKWLNWKWLQWLGVISYSLYLLHNPITGASFRVLNKVLSPSILSNLVEIIITISACLLISFISYYLIEKPSIKMSHFFKIPNKKAK